MTPHSLTLQSPAQAPPLPPLPPIPALPGTPGGAAGGGGAEAPQGAPAPAEAPSGFGSQRSSSELPFDPEAVVREAVPIFGMTLAMIVVIFIGWPLARAFARRLDRRAELGTVRAADLQPQIRQLQESIDTMAVELERISESQRFQAKLMAERPQALPSEQKRA